MKDKYIIELEVDVLYKDEPPFEDVLAYALDHPLSRMYDEGEIGEDYSIVSITKV